MSSCRPYTLLAALPKWQCLLGLLLGLSLLGTPAWAQSEAESSQNVVRITNPQGEGSWDVTKGAEVNLVLDNDKQVYGHIERVEDSAMVITGHAIPLQEIKVMRVKESKQFQEGIVLLGIAGFFFLMLGLSPYLILFGLYAAGIVLALGIGMLICGAILTPLLAILGFVAMAAASVRYVRARGWRMRVVKRAPGKPSETVRKVD
jgi:hypothetical protein